MSTRDESLPGAMQEEQQTDLEFIGHGWAVSKTSLGEPWRGKALRTSCYML